MKTTMVHVGALCGAALLLACAGPGHERLAADAPKVVLGAEDYYQKARTAHLAGRSGEAEQAYAAALKADPAHAGARNGRAVLYAEQGALAQALPIWRDLAQTATGPDSAYVLSNLGYALLLQGDVDGARKALERACLLDPLSVRAWQHLAQVMDKLGEPERARHMVEQAAALQAHDFRADYAIAPRAGVVAIEQALKRDGGNDAQPVLRQRADGIYELRRLEPMSIALAAPAPVAAARVMLEIRNGNGVTGMARALSRTMDQGAVRVVRLSNEKGFRVRQTRIEYRSGYRAAAELLAARLGAATLQQMEGGKPSDMRLVIGHDLAGLRPDSFVQHQTAAGHARDNGANHIAITGASP